jgi:mono/diheme cytochrome c family protein
MQGYMARTPKPAQGRTAGRQWGNALSALAAAVAFAAVLPVLSAAPVYAQETLSMQAQFGRSAYRLYCIGCHGADGRGNRAVAEALHLPLVDLTQLRKRNGGVFPTEEIAAAIAGTRMGGHRELMPRAWAEVFADEFERFAERLAANALVTRRIEHMVAYLESIQAD